MTKRRIQPLRALRAVRALIADPDETSLVFEIIEALAGNHGERIYLRLRRSPSGARILAERRDLLATLSDHERLLALPEGTLGRTYAEFMSAEQITADGLVDASESIEDDDPDLPEERRLVGARLRDMHDLWHVVSGYGRDIVGEACLLSFTYAQTRHRGIGLIVLAAWLKSGGEMRYARRLIREAFGRGRRAAWLPEQDWEALLERPLDEVRRELRVGPPPRYEPFRSDAAPVLTGSTA